MKKAINTEKNQLILNKKQLTLKKSINTEKN